jgi:quinol monooxygenase YgiN
MLVLAAAAGRHADRGNIMTHAGSDRIVRMAEMEIDPAVLNSYKTFLAEEIEASINTEPGVLMLCAVADKDAPAHIRILEVYADQQAYEAICVRRTSSNTRR